MLHLTYIRSGYVIPYCLLRLYQRLLVFLYSEYLVNVLVQGGVDEFEYITSHQMGTGGNV